MRWKMASRSGLDHHIGQHASAEECRRCSYHRSLLSLPVGSRGQMSLAGSAVGIAVEGFGVDGGGATESLGGRHP